MSDENLLRAVERLGQTLEAAGMARMPSRVFAYMIAEDRTVYTAKELAEGLHVSPAAISGAVRSLGEARMIARERAVGHRGDIFRIAEGDLWGNLLRSRDGLVEAMVQGVDDALALLDTDGPGAQRMRETRAFWEFTREAQVRLVEEWAIRRAELGFTGPG